MTESNSTTGNGIIFTEKSSLNEEGKLQSDTLMMVNGKKYDNQADFEKALDTNMPQIDTKQIELDAQTE